MIGKNVIKKEEISGVEVKETLEELGLTPKKKTILFFAGGEFGLGKNATLEILKTEGDYKTTVYKLNF